MSRTKILVAVLMAIAITIGPINSLIHSQAEEPLALQLSFDQPYYSTDQKFNTIVTVSNPSDKKTSNATVKFYLGKRLDLEKDRSLPDEPPQKPLFSYSWSRSFKPGETQLTVARKIQAMKITEGTYLAWAVITSKNKTIASKRSALVVIDPKVVPPLAVTLLWNLDGGVHFDSNGVFIDKKIQKDCMTESNNQGILAVHLSALNMHPNFKVNMNFSPLLARQVIATTKGYKIKKDDQIIEVPKDSKEAQNAQQILSGFQRVVKNGQIEMVPAPFSYPSLDYLATQDWKKDFFAQVDRGRNQTKETFSLTAEPTGTYVPDLKLTSNAFNYLAGSSAKYTVLDETYLKVIDPNIKDIYKPYRLEDEQNNRLTAFFSDKLASSILSDTSDAEAAVQQLLGVLAEVYLQHPEKQKVVTIAPGEEEFQPNAEFLEALYTRLEQIPWLKSTGFSVAAQLISPDTKPILVPKESVTASTYNPDYSKKLIAARKTILQFEAMTTKPHPLEKKLSDYLLISEAQEFLESKAPEEENLGLGFLGKIEKEVRAEMNKVDIDNNQTITLTSSKGKIPIAINNRTLYPFDLTITVESANLGFPTGNSKKIRLHPRENLYTIPVVTKGSAPQKVKVILHYQDYVVKEGSMTVKSMYYNFTIFIILGLIVVAIALPLAWRFLRQRYSE